VDPDLGSVILSPWIRDPGCKSLKSQILDPG
jgi:hypothetical protein